MTGLRATLYTRAGCPPCFALRRLARRASRRTGIPLAEHEVSGDPELEARFGSDVPVLLVAGQPPLTGRIAAAEVDAAFHRAARSAGARRPRWLRWLAAIGIAAGGTGGGPAS